jgi:hypothetical protein
MSPRATLERHRENPCNLSDSHSTNVFTTATSNLSDEVGEQEENRLVLPVVALVLPRRSADPQKTTCDVGDPLFLLMSSATGANVHMTAIMPIKRF